MVDLWCRTRDVDGPIAVPLVGISGRSMRSPRATARSHPSRAISPRAGRGGARRARGLRRLESGGFIFGDFFPAYDGVLSHRHGRAHAGQAAA